MQVNRLEILHTCAATVLLYTAYLTDVLLIVDERAGSCGVQSPVYGVHIILQ